MSRGLFLSSVLARTSAGIDVAGISWPMNLPVFPAFGRQAFEHRIISKHPRPVHDDVLHFNTQSGSQWSVDPFVSDLLGSTKLIAYVSNYRDGLRHYGFKKEKLFYNGKHVRHHTAHPSQVLHPRRYGKVTPSGMVFMASFSFYQRT